MSMRAPALDDADAVARLFARAYPEPLAPSVFRRAWTQPRFDLACDARVALSGTGEVAGYADAEAVGDDAHKAWIWVLGEPGDELAEWAERRAAELVAPPVRLFANVSSENEPGRRLLERRGFRRVRSSYRMAIDLDGEPARPAWPEGIAVRTFRPGDERTFYDVHQETFEDHWEHTRRPYDEWAHWFLAPEHHRPELWFLALAGDEPAGVSMCSPDEARAEVGWVAILGVRRPWRKRGLGKALLLHSFAELARHGFRRVQLGVDAESITGAVRLYERAGMRVVHRSDSYEKAL
ncbi:MAG: GNAT family N-acetyltransferase [Thermoleophilia bacterium]|nr:GNAT family N-acetyltransferase [Thermoleophilia bacterium]